MVKLELTTEQANILGLVLTLFRPDHIKPEAKDNFNHRMAEIALSLQVAEGKKTREEADWLLDLAFGN